MNKIIIALLICILITPTILAEAGDCPRGEIDCDMPCGLYVDANADGECDHSLQDPSDSQITLKEDPPTNSEEIILKANSKSNRVYHFIPISMALIILYLISHILSKKNIISVVKHRKIWNILLLITFLSSAILGLLLVIKINFGMTFNLPFNMLFWHVETGIGMTLISIFHMIWHWPYFKNMFKLQK